MGVGPVTVTWTIRHRLGRESVDFRDNRVCTLVGVLARALTSAVVGLEPRRVEVEAHLVSSDLPAFSIVGLADRACQEAKHRVHCGIVNAMLPWPGRNRITVNLAPAALRKEGSGFDLPIALALLAGSHQLSPERLLQHG